MTNLPEAAVDALLGAVEAEELGSLQWGFVDGSLSRDTVRALAERALELTATNGDPDDLVITLLDQRLLLRFAMPNGEQRYRSRFAEGTRLLTRLRQWFPDRDGQRPDPGWRSASNLVSDFRVATGPRHRARRSVRPEQALRELGLAPSSFEGQAALAILGSGGTALTLARFQVDAAREILRDEVSDRGVVISAGTGSGKSLAFYLPVLTSIAPLVRAGDDWVKAVAIYPRVELLKDQFQSAYELARQLDGVLRQDKRRPIRIGALYQGVPQEPTVASLRRAKWEETPNRAGWRCPFLRCPAKDCDGTLVWRTSDLEIGRAELHCDRHGCSTRVGDDTVVLTRQGMRMAPPDLVFATLEMISQRLSDTRMRPAIGLHGDSNRRPRFVLLDEVHTYEGTSGAQSALALRRWRHALGRPLCWVGLSATLEEAERFFAELTGVAESRVREITPLTTELDAVSGAYDLILRGDPVSQVSLLSTSIQAVFLLARLLDPWGAGRSNGRFGERTFVFTDDLDVTNRLYDDLRSAEGYSPGGRPIPGRLPLAALREHPSDDETDDWRRRGVAGQNWRTCQELGWNLRDRLSIGRTSSQDRGVDARVEVIVATSSLEIGFDDPRVGAVLQHKSPRAFAPFVQRKGRAGRNPLMRPWMVTVLSDYGRDRLTFQAYDQLLAPRLRAQRLPVRNGYILRIQATLAFIDWLAAVAQRSGQGWNWWWAVLNGPPDTARQRSAQVWAAGVLRDLLNGDGGYEASLRTHLRMALGVDDVIVDQVLWEAPRSLMLEVIPTLLRRIATKWQTSLHSARSGVPDIRAEPPAVHPLPDFVTNRLFGELSLPEVAISVPPTNPGEESRIEWMGITMALAQLAPGRVTRRFAPERGELCHWLPVPLSAPRCALPLTQVVARSEPLTTVLAEVDGSVQEIPCHRPWRFELGIVANSQVSASSNARMWWGSQFVPPADGALRFALDREHGWGRIVTELAFFLHSRRAPVTTRRFTTGATASVRRPRAESLTIEAQFVGEDGAPAALGFEQEVDALVVRIHLPSGAELATRANGRAAERAWRTAYFRDRVLTDSELRTRANVFERDWLHQIYVAALVSAAAQAGETLERAQNYLNGNGGLDTFRAAIETTFRIDESFLDEDVEGHGTGRLGPQSARLARSLADLTTDPAVRRRLDILARELWAPDPVAWASWLRTRVHETLGEALILACQMLAPRAASAETLRLDLNRDVRVVAASEEQAELWISEATPGGIGAIEAILEAFGSDRRSLFRSLDAALTPSDLEVTSEQLDAFLDLLVRDTTVRLAALKVRQTQDHGAQAIARSALYLQLAARGLAVSHTLSVALHHRLLREGMEIGDDELVKDLITWWGQLEAFLGVAIDLRVFCAVALRDVSLGSRVRTWLQRTGGGRLNDGELVGVLAGVLWARPAEIRGRSLESYSPYRDRGRTDAALVSELLLEDDALLIDLAEGDWRQRVSDELSRSAVVRLRAMRGSEAQLQAALLELVVTPVNVGFLQFFPIVEGLVRSGWWAIATLVLRELATT